MLLYLENICLKVKKYRLNHIKILIVNYFNFWRQKNMYNLHGFNWKKFCSTLVFIQECIRFLQSKTKRV